jgi:oligosaccharide repeat unit polymerase
MRHSAVANYRSASSSLSEMNILTGSALAVAILTVLVLQTLNSNNAAVSLSILTIFISGMTATRRFKRHGIEPLALFCFMFALYDGVMLFRLATIGADARLPYPGSFGPETYAATGVLCAIAAGAVLITTIAWEITIEPFIDRRRSAQRELAPHQVRSRTWFWSGLCLYAAGIFLYFVQFQSFGGYFAALAMGRGDRFDLAGSGDVLSYPYLAFVAPGIACMCYGSEVHKAKRQQIASYVLAAVWCALVGLQGDRRLVVQTALTIIGVLSVLRPKALKLRLRTWVLIIAAYLISSIFGYVRPQITAVASGRATTTEAVAQSADDWSTDWLLPEHSELAGPYLSLLSAVSDDTQLRYGSSYSESLFTILPRFLYPGYKPEGLADGFARKVHQGGGAAAGWGFNPVAEAYLNFGTIGVALLFFCWAVFFLVLGAIKHGSAWGTLVAATLLSEAMNANRIDFRNVYGETAYFFMGLMLAAFLNSLIASVFSRRKARSFHAPGTFSAVTAA